MADARSERARALDAEREALNAPHRKQIEHLSRLIAVERLHIDKNDRLILMKREGLRFIRSSLPEPSNG